jgi:hypothetical protein
MSACLKLLFHGMAPISCLFSLPCLKPHQPQ